MYTATIERTGSTYQKFNNTNDDIVVRHGDIWLVNLEGAKGSELNLERPFFIMQNDIGNKFSPTTFGYPMTSRVEKKKKLPTHVFVDALEHGLDRDSVICFEQPRTLDKKYRFIHKLSHIDYRHPIMKEVKMAYLVSAGFGDNIVAI